jgi:hypothetical protein
MHAPHGCPVIIGWELAAWLWRHHLPDPLRDRDRCARCRLPMPCLCWRFADGFLADAIDRAQEATRELPRVDRPPLPRRQPGAQLGPEEKFGGWFTQ